MIVMKYLHICGKRRSRSRKESRRSGRRTAESPVCRAGAMQSEIKEGSIIVD